MPGRPLVNAFAHRAGLQAARARTMYIRAAASSERNPFAEVLAIFDSFTHDVPAVETTESAPVAAAGN